jgi:hypothetical protein
MAEPMAWPPRDDEALGLALSDLARALAFPETPAIAPAVASRVRGQRMRWWTRRTLGRSIGLALLVLLVLAGAAVAFGLVIGGLRITLAPGTAPPIPSGVVQRRAFGSELGLAEASRRAGFSILLPSPATIGHPDHVYFIDFPTGGTVSLVWGPRKGYPAGTDGVGVVVTEFQASVDPRVWEKMIYNDTTILRTRVGSHAALWISGGDHAYFYRDANGRMVDTSLRLVGSALIWEQNGLLLRVEGASDLLSALAVGGALR